MTSNEMIEHIAAELWRVQVVDAGAPASVSHRRTPEAFADHDDRTRDVFLRYATAVLDLCGPKLLEWRHPSSANFRKGECFHARCATHHHAVHKKQDGWWYNVDSKTYPTLEAAQAAAQAHADAAHWANTKMGGA